MKDKADKMTPLTIRGRLFEANASTFHEASLQADPDSALLVLKSQHGEVLVNRADCTLSEKIGSIPRKLTLGDGRIFECSDQKGLKVMFRPLRTSDKTLSLVAWMEEFRLRLIAIVMGLGGLAALVVVYIMPIGFDAAAHILPYEVENEMARHTLKILDKALLKTSELPANKQQAVSDVFAELLDTANLPPERYSLMFRKGGAIGANALALPGGTVVITDELLELAGSEDAYAGVLAHEIGHVEEKHGTRLFLRTLGLSVIFMLALDDVSGVMESVILFPGFLLELSYSRDFEREADDFSIDLMHKAGRDPAAMAQLLKDMTKNCGKACEETSFLGTHPGLTERLDTLSNSR